TAGLSEKLVNYEGNIPFSPESFDMIIPVTDTTTGKINLTILNNDSLIYSGVITESTTREIKLAQCGDEIFLQDVNPKVATKNFILRKFTSRLTEGKITIKVETAQNGLKNEEFIKNVVWYDEPRSLQNSEYSIKILKYIATPEEINSLLEVSDKERFQTLIKFWKKFDPTPKTVYNELMEEYYQRVDYSIKNFSTLAARNGAETDRGKVYIKYGMPSKIDRLFSDNKDVKEIWNYQNPNKKFIFVDKTGLGNYSLIENQ
ncbi:MAG: GWxTD domain-containing protein, partial [Methanococcaceae archaeon]